VGQEERSRDQGCGQQIGGVMEQIRIMRVRWWQIILIIGLMVSFLTISIIDGVRISKLSHRINQMQLNQEQEAQICVERSSELKTLQNKLNEDILKQICDNQQKTIEILRKELKLGLLTVQEKTDLQMLTIQKRIDEDRESLKQEMEVNRQRLVALRMTLNNMDDKIQEGDGAFKIHMKEIEEGGRYWIKRFESNEAAIAGLKKSLGDLGK